MRKLLYIIAMLPVAFVSCDIDMEPTDREIELEDSLNAALNMIDEINSQLNNAKDSAGYYEGLLEAIKSNYIMTFHDGNYTLEEFIEFMEEDIFKKPRKSRISPYRTRK